MELAQQTQNALVELGSEGGTPSDQLHVQKNKKNEGLIFSGRRRRT